MSLTSPDDIRISDFRLRPTTQVEPIKGKPWPKNQSRSFLKCGTEKKSTVSNYLWAHPHSFVAPQFDHTLVWEA